MAQSVTTAPEAPKLQVQSYAYTPFGEQLGGVKVSGFTYNAEAYDAVTGMINLRARQYELTMGRFSQKDILRGSIQNPLSLNRYAYVLSNPISYADPSGKANVAVADSGKPSGNIAQTTANALVKSAKAAADEGNQAKIEAIIKKLQGIWNTFRPKRRSLYVMQ